MYLRGSHCKDEDNSLTYDFLVTSFYVVYYYLLYILLVRRVINR